MSPLFAMWAPSMSRRLFPRLMPARNTPPMNMSFLPPLVTSLVPSGPSFTLSPGTPEPSPVLPVTPPVTPAIPFIVSIAMSVTPSGGPSSLSRTRNFSSYSKMNLTIKINRNLITI